MKRTIFALAIGMLIGSAATAFAANSEAVQAVFAKFNLQINNQKAVEIEPLVFDGTTYLPVRTLGEILGFEVDYDDKTRTIIYKGDESTMDNVVLTDDWISLRQLAEKGIEVTISPGNILTIKNNENEIRLSTSDIVTDQTVEANLYDSSGTIFVKSQNDQTYLRVDQLQMNGILD